MTNVTEAQIVIALAIIGVHFVFREAAFERAKVRKNNLYFPPVFGLRIFFWLGVPIFLFAAYEVFGEIRSGFDWVYPVLFLAFAALIFLSYPGTITLNTDGVNFRRYLGLRVKRMKWDAIASMVSSKGSKTISVYGHDGTSIVHTQFNVDPLRFKTELTNRLPLSIIEQ